MFRLHIYRAHVPRPGRPAGPGCSGIVLPGVRVWAAFAFPALLARHSLHACIPRCRRVDCKTRALTLPKHIAALVWTHWVGPPHTVCATRRTKHCCSRNTMCFSYVVPLVLTKWNLEQTRTSGPQVICVDNSAQFSAQWIKWLDQVRVACWNLSLLCWCYLCTCQLTDLN